MVEERKRREFDRLDRKEFVRTNFGPEETEHTQKAIMNKKQVEQEELKMGLMQQMHDKRAVREQKKV